MERVGILVVAYGAREVAIVDVFLRSQNYDVEIYIADRQKNPFNAKKAAKHVVIPDLSVEKICKFADANKAKIDFGIVGPEKPIIDGVRDLVEERTKIPFICPKKDYAIEASKVQQRLLFDEVMPEVNPDFKIFDPNDYRNLEEVKKAVYSWLDQLQDKAVVKPDRPAAGKGVGVWGDHFATREQLFEHFLENFQHGSVIVEEKIEGEESSFQALCDGEHLVPLPETRDYKRAFDGDKGPNTGGMGSYKDFGEFLPFMTANDRRRELTIVNAIFKEWKARADDRTALRGMPFYMAFIHTGKEPKILENNSRPGDPEIINILPILKDDFVDVCFKILDGALTRVELEKSATVLTYKVPPNYAGYIDVHPELVNKAEVGQPVDLTKAYKLTEKHGDSIRIFPASMELRDNGTYALKSRAVGVLGIGEDIEEARQISLEGIRAIRGGALWWRKDIASKRHIKKSVKHMKELRQKR
ncbi:MAG: phosphoribosylamine--glycine ligase [Candidatus Bathycorpusculaceae bacterium]